MPLFGKKKAKDTSEEKARRSKPSASSQQQRRSAATPQGRSTRPAANETSGKGGATKSRKKTAGSASAKGSRPRPKTNSNPNPPPEQQPQEYSFHQQAAAQQQQARPAPAVAPRPPQEQQLYNGGVADPNVMSTPSQMDGYSSSAGSHPNPTTVVQNITVGDESLATIEITRELVKQFIADIWNRGEIELIPQVCHPSLRFNGHVGMDRVGHEGFARMVTTVREALTDYHCEIHSMVVETNKAFCRLRFTGKHTGNLLGYPPTGKTVAWMGASEFTCKNGKILKVWELGDVKSLEEQLRSVD